MTDSPDTERRSSPRRVATWRVLFGIAGELAPGFLADISLTGVSILSEKPYAAGTEIELHFGADAEHAAGKVLMRAVVRHCDKGKIGAEFIHLEASHREHLWKIMRGVV